MSCKLRQVLRCLLTLVHRECGGRKRSGGLMVVMRALCEPAILTVFAAGAWCSKVSKSALKEAMERLSLQVPPCECVHQEELQRFTDKFGSLIFSYSFHASSLSVQEKQSEIQRFLHRLSLVHAQVEIIFEIRTDSTTHKQMFSGVTGSKVLVMDHSISMEAGAYGQSPFSVRSFPSCPRMHPVLGDKLSCVLPTDIIGVGLCGEMNMVTMATLAPCMDQYSNWPSYLSCIRNMLVYSPCGMPLMQQTQMSFLQSLATSLSWADLGLSKVCCIEAQKAQGSLCSDVEFSVETDYSQETRCSGNVQQNIEAERSHAVEQTLTVFIFTQYTDPFCSQIPDFISSEEVFERHLDAVLWHNGDQVRTTLQSTMKKTLNRFQKRHAARQTLDSAVSIVLSSVNSVIASSSSGEFRKACFDSMRVKSSCELRVSLQQSLQSIVDGHFTLKSTCNKEMVAEAVSPEQSSPDCWEKAFENPSKRIHCDFESASFIPKKRQCSEPFSENSAIFMDSVFETANIQRSPLSSIQLPQSQQTGMIADMPSSLSLAKLNNEQVEKQWLQELENFSEWD